MIRLWFIGWYQCREERRVARFEKIADQLIIDADPDYARYLGILPPMPIQNVRATVLMGNAFQAQQQDRIAALFGQMNTQHVRSARDYGALFGAVGGMIGGPAMGASFGALGGALGGLLGKGGKHGTF